MFFMFRFLPQRNLTQATALSLLEDHLTGLGYSGESFYFDNVFACSIDDVQVYSTEVRWSTGIMSNHLFMILAVSVDGTRFFQYNLVDDTWAEI
jgi:hypothetical protein